MLDISSAHVKKFEKTKLSFLKKQHNRKDKAPESVWKRKLGNFFVWPARKLKFGVVVAIIMYIDY